MKTIAAKTSLIEKVKGVVLEKCPYCNKGNIFRPGKRIPFQVPDMKERCDVCDTNLDREPGYFFGAMYVSYAMAVGEGIITYLLLANIFRLQNTAIILVMIIFVILLLQNKNFRVSRIIWMHLFGY
jgi:uncharacterized protein (DUF983 family)